MLLSDSHELFSTTTIGLTCHAQSLAAAISWVAEQAPPLQLTSSTTTTERSTLLPSSVRAATHLPQRLAPLPCFLMQGRHSGALTAARAWDTQSGRPLSRVPPLPTCSLKSAEPPCREMLAEY